MRSLPSLDGLNWAKIRQVARELASSAPIEEVNALAHQHLTAADAAYRQLAVYLLGFASGASPGNLEVLRMHVVPDPHWAVQEALAQAFDTYCAAVGYEWRCQPSMPGWRMSIPRPGALSRKGYAPGPASAGPILPGSRRRPFADLQRSAPIRVSMCATRWATRSAIFGGHFRIWSPRRRQRGTLRIPTKRSPASACSAPGEEAWAATPPDGRNVRGTLRYICQRRKQ